MTTPTFKDLAEAAATGLQADPELYLDVTQELHAHLEDRAEKYERAGHSPEESAELAAQRFGSPLDVANDIVQTNLRRMKGRALARLALRYLLIPAALVVALLIAGDVVRQMRPVQFLIAEEFTDTDARIRESIDYFALTGDKEKAERLRFLINGDAGTATREAQLLSIWQRYPGNKAYYASFFVNLHSAWKKDDPESMARTLANYKDAMQIGMRLDPENALYNYTLAERLFHLGATLESDPKTPGNNLLVIKNRDYCEQAMQQLQQGAAKPNLTVYAEKLLAERQALVHPQSRFSGVIMSHLTYNDMMIVSPSYGFMRFSKGVVLYADLLRREGRPAEACAILDSWMTYVTHRATGSALMEILIANVALTFAGDEGMVADQYELLGDKATAERLRQLAKEALELRTYRGSSNWNIDQVMKKEGGYLAGMMVPRIMYGDFTVSSQDLANSRALEYVMLEQGALAVLIGVLGLCLVGTWIAAMAWWRGTAGRPPRRCCWCPAWRSGRGFSGWGCCCRWRRMHCLRRYPSSRVVEPG